MEDVNRELWKSIQNYSDILSCNCLNFLALVVFFCGKLLSRPEPYKGICEYFLPQVCLKVFCALTAVVWRVAKKDKDCEKTTGSTFSCRMFFFFLFSGCSVMPSMYCFLFLFFSLVLQYINIFTSLTFLSLK